MPEMICFLGEHTVVCDDGFSKPAETFLGKTKVIGGVTKRRIQFKDTVKRINGFFILTEFEKCTAIFIIQFRFRIVTGNCRKECVDRIIVIAKTDRATPFS